MSTSDQPEPCEISTDPARLQLPWVLATLRGTYWARQRTEDVLRRAVAGSLCFGAYRRSSGAQVGFARVVTDQATFAWLCDVVVDPAERGRGIGQQLVAAVLAEPRLVGVSFHLATQDAHGLYARFGFTVNQTMRRGSPPPGQGVAFSQSLPPG